MPIDYRYFDFFDIINNVFIEKKVKKKIRKEKKSYRDNIISITLNCGLKVMEISVFETPLTDKLTTI